jgi:hypothetical protein
MKPKMIFLSLRGKVMKAVDGGSNSRGGKRRWKRSNFEMSF